MAEGFKLTPAQEAYYDKLKTRDKFEDILSEAICEVITTDADKRADDPIEGMIRALQKHRRQPSKWTAISWHEVQDILAKARKKDQEAQERAAQEREDVQTPQAGPGHTRTGPVDLKITREAEWNSIRWLQQLEVHKIVSNILEGAKEHNTEESNSESGTRGIEYVKHLQGLGVGVKIAGIEPTVRSRQGLKLSSSPHRALVAGLEAALRGRRLHQSPGREALRRDREAYET